MLFRSATALGTGTFTINGGTLNNTSGAPLTLTTNNTQNWNGSYTFTGSNALNLGTGPVTLGAATTAAGRYTISGVPAGVATVRVRRVGYAPGEARVTVRDNETATQNFALSAATARLDQVIVTGTAGGTQMRAIGNVVESVKAADVIEKAPITNVGQLIGGRTPGVIMLPSSGQVGTGAQIRIRGVSSLSLTNDPILYIDGVQIGRAHV